MGVNSRYSVVTFFADGPLFLEDDNKYYEFAFHHLYERYRNLADTVQFAIRVKRISGSEIFTQVPEEVIVREIPNTKSPASFLGNYPIARRLIEDIVKESDCVVLRVPNSLSNIAFRYVEKYNKPCIVEVVGCAWDSYWNHSLVGKIVAPYMYLKTRSVVHNSRWLYYVTSEFLQKRYPPQDGAQIVCCSNVELLPVDSSVLDRRLERIDALKQGVKRLVLGTAAAVDTRYKGQEYVIKAINILLSEGIEVEYHLAGAANRNPEDSYLYDLAAQEGVQDRVHFHGGLPAERMKEFYDSLDLYIQPSKQEGLPRAVIEAMSRGVPCIGTSIAGIPELLQPECLFKKGSETEVAQAVMRVVGMDLKAIACSNYEQAKNYESAKLESRRSEFYLHFLQECQGK